MATDLEQLVLSISADNRQMLRVLKKLEGDTSATTRKVEKQFDQMAKKIDARLSGIGTGSFKNLIGGITAALGAGELVKLTDTWTDLNSRVKLAAGSMEKGQEVMGRLSEVARRTYSSLEQTAEGYLLNATAMRELGYSTDQTLDYTESVNNALVISGAKGQRAEAVMNALSKAMAGGALKGDNLNTVIEQGGRLAEALAEGLGVGVNQLRALGQQGKITGRDIVASLSKQMEKLRAEAEAMPATISDGIQLLQNALLEYVGNADHATGVSAKISEALVIMADNFDKTADRVLQFAAVIAGALIGRSISGMIAKLGLSGKALYDFTRAMAAAGAMTRLSMGFSGLAAAAGPVGMIIGGAVVSSLILYSSATADASEGAQRFADRLDEISKRAEGSAEKVEAAGERYNEALKNALGHENTAAQSQFDDAHDAVMRLLDGAIETAPALKLVRDEAGNLSRQPMASQDQLDDLRRVRDSLKENGDGAEAAKQELFALANSNPNFQKLADQLAPLLDRLALVAQGAREAAAEMAVVNGGMVSGRGPNSRGGAGNARRALDARKEESRLWEVEQTRRAKLGKDQLALENEIARVKKQAADDGIRVTEDQIKRIAQANLAGSAARSAEGKKPKQERDNDYERLTKRINESVAAMQAENAVLAGLDPLVNDYGYALEKARIQQELLTAAKRAGIEVTPALEQEISVLADTYAFATVEAAKLAESQDEIRQRAEEALGAAKDVTRDLIDGLIEGKSAGDMLASTLKKIGNALIDDVLNNLFKIQNMGGGGGFLSGLLGLFGGGGGGSGGGIPWAEDIFRANGGPVRAGQPYIVGEKRPELFVPNRSGTIIPQVPQMPRLQAPASQAGPSITFAPVIDARGADVAAVERLAQVMEKQKREFEANVISTIRNARSRRVPGI
ncbi:tape measure domain-containing protein [Pseudaminobacter salicylatoxidans]|uniref:Tape measure domain-containing protein n=1 Tax=Pseudaminobacter salicylatoxidans TaxID=93369 RepID=A0A316BM24_PSESE|nr:tape measure protein [Pseudaminobacter salicylatoxidans]PWJ73825.1 tape measure domain-containing protein [Pseudaminobacter salicylatoxidans]